jgi:hypothetical protein
MKMTPVTPEALKRLPGAIWMQGSRSIYRGSPVEMVRQMAAEMGADLSVHTTIDTLLTALYLKRGLLIAIPEDAPEDVVAALFVHALLDAKVSKPIVALG